MNVLIINGHPDRESLETTFAIAYRDAALLAADSVQEIEISSLKRQIGSRNFDWAELEKARKKIVAAHRIVWIHPAWSTGFPKDTTVFVQMLFTRKNMYKGKTARIITTMEEPGIKYRILKGRALINRMKKGVLEKAGIHPVRVSNFGCVRNANREKQLEMIRKATVLGRE